MAESHKHKLLKQVAMRWLQSTGCVAFAFEVSFYSIGIVDVMGLKECGDTYIVEAKASYGDLKNDMREHGYRYRYGGKYSKLSKVDKIERSTQMDFVYYIVADGIDISELPVFIGILNEAGAVKRRAKRRRQEAKNDRDKLASFVKIAKALSWRKYGYVINHEQEQVEFSLMNDIES
jgi:hypothetical protein